MSYTWILPLFLIIFALIIASREEHRRKRRNRTRKKTNKGGNRIMPTELLKEYIDKEVHIFIDGEIAFCKATIRSIEGNWIKAETKKEILLVNADMVRQINIAK